ncbi:MAG: hypothetical protein ACRD4K_11355 [Candidatus Acidiferrales bacterium]
MSREFGKSIELLLTGEEATLKEQVPATEMRLSRHAFDQRIERFPSADSE